MNPQTVNSSFHGPSSTIQPKWPRDRWSEPPPNANQNHTHKKKNKNMNWKQKKGWSLARIWYQNKITQPSNADMYRFRRLDPKSQSHSAPDATQWFKKEDISKRKQHRRSWHPTHIEPKSPSKPKRELQTQEACAVKAKKTKSLRFLYTVAAVMHQAEQIIGIFPPDPREKKKKRDQKKAISRLQKKKKKSRCKKWYACAVANNEGRLFFFRVAPQEPSAGV